MVGGAQGEGGLAGRVVAGRYRLGRRLGSGGSGQVYAAEDLIQPRQVALKLVPGLARLPEVTQRRFQREVTALGSCQHPGIVSLLDHGSEGSDGYLVTELVPGGTLADRVRQGPLPLDEAIQITRRIAPALEHAHGIGLLHRDVKPSNVLLDPARGPRLTDFGLARDLDPSLSRASLTGEGAVLGTPGFWSPEQALGQADRIGPGTDVYGLGATLYAALTGSPPHEERGSVMELLDRIVEPPAPPSTLRPGLPAWLDAIVLKALAQAPSERFPTAAAFVQALSLAEQEGEGPGRAQTRWGPQRSLAAALLLAGGGLALGSLVLSPLLDPSAVSPSPQASTHQRSDPSPSPSALASAPDAIADALARARDLAAGGDTAAALAAVRAAQQLAPRAAEGSYLKGTLLEAEQEGLAAGAAYHRAFTLDPTHAGAALGRIKALVALDMWPEALEVCDQALSRHPESAALLQQRAVVLVKLERIPAAEADLRRAIEAGQDGWVDAKATLGKLLLELKRTPEALPLLREAVDEGSGEACETLGRYLIQRPTKADEGLALLRLATKRSPNALRARAFLGMALRQQNRDEEAREILTQVLNEDPEQLEPRHQLALAQVVLGQLEEARDNIRRILREDDDHFHDAPQRRQRLQPVQSALEYMGKAYSDKRPARVELYWAEVLRLGGRLQDALRAAERAIDLAPSAAAGFNLKGQLLLQLDRRQEAALAIERALALDPDSSGALRLKAELEQEE